VTAARDERLLSRAFLVLIATGTCYFTAFGMVVPVLPRFVEGPLGGSDVAVGLTFGAFGLGAVALRPVAGRIGDRSGRRILILAGALIATLASATYFLVDGVPLLVGARLLQGVGEAAFWVGIATSVADLTPERRRGEGMSYFSVALYTGTAFGPVLGEVVLDAGGYDQVWLVATVLFGAAVLLGLCCPDVRPAVHAGARSRFFPRAAYVPGLILFLGISGIAGFSAFVPLYAEDLGLDDVSIVFLVFGVVTLFIRVAGARLPDRLGPLRAGTVATVGLSVGLAVIAAWSSVLGLFVGTVVMAIGVAFLYPGAMTLALMGVPEHQRASVVGAVSMCFDLAGAIGALTLGVIASLAGDRGVFVGGAVLSVIAVVVLRSGLDPRVHEHGTAPRPDEELHEPEITG
jgi:MFS family permease